MNANEKIEALQRAEFESMVSMAEKTLEGFEKMAELNVQTLREAAQDAAAALRAALSARDLEELMSAGTAGSVQAGSQRALTYAQHAAQIAGNTQANLAAAMNDSMTRIRQAWREAVETGFSDLLPASDTAAGLMQSALDFAAAAFQTMTRSQAQGAEATSERVQNVAGTGTAAAARRTGARRPAAASGLH